MVRKFVYEGKEYPDPDPAMKPDEVRQLWTDFFPELANATTKMEKKGEDEVITFSKKAGTKGSENVFGVKNFIYNGFGVTEEPDIAPYTAKFSGWTDDPGIGIFDCSDGQQRLIPTCSIIGDLSQLPEQEYGKKVYFGTPSHS